MLKPYSGSGPSNDDQGMLDLSGEAGGTSAGNTAAENSDVKFPTTVALDDVQDRTAAILDARAERRKAQRFQKRAGDAAMARANLSGATSPGGAALPGGAAASGNATGHHPKPDWRDAYLPGRDVDAVMGIDIETTGIDPARDYIIDVGFEFMNMASPRPAGEPETYAYEQGYYAAGDAYGQSRLAFWRAAGKRGARQRPHRQTHRHRCTRPQQRGRVPTLRRMAPSPGRPARAAYPAAVRGA